MLLRESIAVLRGDIFIIVILWNLRIGETHMPYTHPPHNTRIIEHLHTRCTAVCLAVEPRHAQQKRQPYKVKQAAMAGGEMNFI